MNVSIPTFGAFYSKENVEERVMAHPNSVILNLDTQYLFDRMQNWNFAAPEITKFGTIIVGT